MTYRARNVKLDGTNFYHRPYKGLGAILGSGVYPTTELTGWRKDT